VMRTPRFAILRPSCDITKIPKLWPAGD